MIKALWDVGADADSSLLLLSVCKEERSPSLNPEEPQPPHHEEMSSPARTVSEDHLKEEPEDQPDLCKCSQFTMCSPTIIPGIKVLRPGYGNPSWRLHVKLWLYEFEHLLVHLVKNKTVYFVLHIGELLFWTLQEILAGGMPVLLLLLAELY